jgi:hypothetical protein
VYLPKGSERLESEEVSPGTLGQVAQRLLELCMDLDEALEASIQTALIDLAQWCPQRDQRERP